MKLPKLQARSVLLPRVPTTRPLPCCSLDISPFRLVQQQCHDFPLIQTSLKTEAGTVCMVVRLDCSSSFPAWNGLSNAVPAFPRLTC